MPIILIIFLNIIRGYKFDFNRGLISSGSGAQAVCWATGDGQPGGHCRPPGHTHTQATIFPSPLNRQHGLWEVRVALLPKRPFSLPCLSPRLSPGPEQESRPIATATRQHNKLQTAEPCSAKRSSGGVAALPQSFSPLGGDSGPARASLSNTDPQEDGNVLKPQGFQKEMTPLLPFDSECYFCLLPQSILFENSCETLAGEGSEAANLRENLVGPVASLTSTWPFPSLQLILFDFTEFLKRFFYWGPMVGGFPKSKSSLFVIFLP